MSVVGIDFGNVQCVIAVARNRGIDVITNEVSNRSTPSLVSFGTKQRYLGESAKTQEISNFKNTVGSFKRLAGRTLKDQDLQTYETQYINAALVEGPTGEVATKVYYQGEERVYTARQLTAMYLSTLKDITQKATNGAVSDCVISVPGYFTDMQRRAILDAAEIAGLNPLRLMNDTTAAALSYGITKTDLPEEKPKNICFVDVGHSTYSVSIVSFVKGKLAVLSTAYDPNWGGRDLDQLLVDHFAEQFKGKYKLDIKSNPRALFRLRTACEKAKKILSANLQAPLNVECIMNDVDVSGMITREEFESLAGPLLERVTAPLEKALTQAGITKEEIDAVEIIGGTSRVPAVKERIKSFFGKELSTTLNSDEAVAKGCALQCAMISPVFKVRDFDVKDITPFAINISWTPTHPDDKAGHLELIQAGSLAPVIKALTVYMRGPFTLQASYADKSVLPAGVDPVIATYQIDDVNPTKEGESVALKIKVRIDVHGALVLSSVQATEELDAAPESAEGSTENVEGDAAAPKKKVSKKDIPFTAKVQSLDKTLLHQLREEELGMVAADQLVRDTEDRKNALEEYIYEARGKLDGAWKGFVVEGDKSYLQDLLSKAEDWLYTEEGEDATKSVYTEKLNELQKIGAPIAERCKEAEARPEAARQFKATAAHYMSWVSNQDEKYAHITPADREQITTRCAEKLQWLENQMAKQSELPKQQAPVIKSAQILTERDQLTYYCNGIINKPKPKEEPKPEEPKAEESADASKTRQEVPDEGKGDSVDDMEVE